MAPHKNEQQISATQCAHYYIEVLLRGFALLSGFFFVWGALWATKDGSYPNITALLSVPLMLICAMSPTQPSRQTLIALLISIVFACIDFVMRALPDMRDENYPIDIAMFYLIELVAVTYFIRKHLTALTTLKQYSGTDP